MLTALKSRFFRLKSWREIRISQDTTVKHGVIFLNAELHLNDSGFKPWRRGVKIRVGRKNVYIGDSAVIAASDTTPNARDTEEIHIDDEVYVGAGAVVNIVSQPRIPVLSSQKINFFGHMYCEKQL
jgi:acetyltransferase-like isoleucine patch superfamily enzyme